MNLNLTFQNLTPKQRHMVETPSRVLWVGAGTKTGKSAAAHTWVATSILQGKRMCWIGPWSEQSFLSYGFIKEILQPAIDAGLVKVNDSKASMTSSTGGSFTQKTGDNPEAIYGPSFDGVVIDEASRQTEESFRAAGTTTSATGGLIKLMFNLDHGRGNWAISNLLRVKSMPEAERMESGEEYMIFPTGGEGLVPLAEIDRMRRVWASAPAMFEALYNAEIPNDDLSLFRNLAEIFKGGPAPEGPELGHHYVAGMDLGRKQNWSVITIFDTEIHRVVAAMRYQEISWTLQYAKAKALYDFWRCGKIVVDSSGLGDPVEEELYKLGLNVEGYQFTERSRNDLIEQMVVACDGKQFSVAQIAEAGTFRAEMEAFGLVLNEKSGKGRYGVAKGTHDDAAFSLMLAWHCFLHGGQGKVDFQSTKTAEMVEETNLDGSFS